MPEENNMNRSMGATEGEHDSHPIVIIIVIVILAVIIGLFFYFGGFAPSDENMLLTKPATGQEAEYESAVRRSAKQSDTLSIGPNCQMDPLVLRFSLGDTLTIKNNDSSQHVIAFEDNKFFSVSPQRSRELSLRDTFGTEPGIYRYRCSDVDMQKNVGVMYITE